MRNKHKRELILDAALELAKEVGYTQVTHAMIAKKVGAPHSSVGYILGSRAHTRDVIVAWALEHRELLVIAQALSFGHPLALQARPEVKTDAAKALLRRFRV